MDRYIWPIYTSSKIVICQYQKNWVKEKKQEYLHHYFPPTKI